jgi:predicted PurR-regulated permease PerM
VAASVSLVQLVGQAPEYQDEVTRAIADLRALLASFGISLDGADLGDGVDPGAILGVVRPIASAISSTGAALFVLAFTLIYALIGAGSLRERAEVAFGREHALLGGVQRFGVDLRRYLLVRAQLGLFAAVLSLVLLWVLGVPFPLLWAFLMFAASFIPNVGFLIALVPPAILAFLEGGLVPAALVVIGYSLINVLQDHLLQPVVMGSELNLSPLVVMLSVIAWAWILGAAGALLAVPLTVALVQILEAYPSTRGFAALMRNKAAPPAEAASG